MATLALNSGLWVRRMLIGGSPFQGRNPASEVNDGACPENQTTSGFAFLDRLNFDPYNEGEDLKARARAYRRRYGHYPKVICADQIYRTHANGPSACAMAFD